MNKKTPQVSVIIPTFNRATLLARSVESVLKQTYQDFELIIVSDGSTDNTDNIVLGYNDIRIKYLKHKKPKGASAARNTGIKICKGQYIAFLDDDDEWTPNKLSLQIPFIKLSNSKVGLIYSWSKYLSTESKIIQLHNPTIKGDVFVHMLDRQAIGSCPSIVIKREVVDVVGFFDESLPRGNDGDYWRRITQKYHVDLIQEYLVNVYVGHSDRISINSKKNLMNALPAFEKWLNIFKNSYKQYPDKELIILTRCFSYCLVAHEYKKALVYLNRSLNTKAKAFLKIKLISKSILLFILKHKIV